MRCSDFPGRYAFRLKQMDLDGAVDYSDEIEADIGVPGAFLLTSAYPNPFNPNTRFELAVAQDQHVSIEVVNELGQRIALLHDDILAGAKTHRFTFNASALPSGVYFYRAVGEVFVSHAGSMTPLK